MDDRATNTTRGAKHLGLRTLDQLDVAGKRVLVRSDLNVPLDEEGRVEDDRRIVAAVRTIKEILDRGGTPVVMAHLGRPKGQPEPALSLRHVADALSQALDGCPVRVAEDCIGQRAREAVDGVRSREDRAVVLLENLRFHSGEKDNDPTFADALASLGNVYVGDAFSAAHRAHASIVGVATRLPSAAGRLMEEELRSLDEALRDAAHPYVAIFGGAKVSTKLGVVHALAKTADVIALAGGMANTVLDAKGVDVGASVRDENTETARHLLEGASSRDCEILLPTDAVVASEMAESADCKVVPVEGVPRDWMILDIGPDSVDRLVEHVRQAKTVVWNGPLGAAEDERFADGTRRVAEAIAARTSEGETTSVVGGGDTVAVLGRMNLLDGFSHVSLAGGAFLEWLRGDELPGVGVLMDSHTAEEEEH